MLLKPDSTSVSLAYDFAALDTTETLEPPLAPAAEEEEKDVAVHRYILKNRFVLKDLDPGSRALVYGAIGALAVTAVAIATRDLPWPDFDVSFSDNRITAIPITHFVLTLVLLGMLWTYMLYGAWRAYLPVRLAGLAIYLGVMTWFAFQIPDWRAAIPALLVVPAIVQRRKPNTSGWWRLGLFFVATELCYAAVAFFAGDQLLFTLTLDDHLYWLSQASIPMLFLVGVELSEVAGHGGRELFHRSSRYARLVPALAVGAAALALGTELWGYDLATNAISVGWGLLVVAILAVAYRFLAPAEQASHLKPLTIVAAIVTLSLGFAVSQAIIYFAPSSAGSGLADYKHASPDFSFQYPLYWLPDRKAFAHTSAPAAVLLDYQGTGEYAAVVAMTADPNADAQSTLSDWLARRHGDSVALTNPGSAGGWTTFDLSGTVLSTRAGSGEAFVQYADGYAYLIYCWAPDDTSWQDLKPGCDGIASSFQTGSGTIVPGPLAASSPLASPSAAPASPSAGTSASSPAAQATSGSDGGAAPTSQADLATERAAAGTTIFWAIVLVASAIVLLVFRSRGRSSQLAWWLFVASLVSFFSRGATGQAGVLTLPGGTQIGTLDTGSLAEAAGLLSLVWIGYRFARRRPLTGNELAWLLYVNVALWVIGLLARLYYAGLDLGELGILQAIVIVLALGWEIFQSGGLITNRSSAKWPRASRVSMFMGYVLLVAVAVLYFSSQHLVDTGEHVAPAFESELWPAYGLAFLGAPLIIATAFTSLPWRRRASDAKESAPAPA